MLRFFAGASSALLLIAAGILVWRSQAEAENPVPAPPAATAFVAPLRQQAVPMPPAAPERSKEERRFDRADKNRDGRITRDELTQPRRKAYAKLDTNGDGRLSFEEWAVKTTEKFAGADADRNGALTRVEYATTRAPTRATPKQDCAC